jgi:putative transcriptional regulator
MNLDIDLFKIEYNKVNPAKGKALVAEPFLRDENFRRSIVFLVEHNDDGTIGFVLNKPVNIPITQVLDDFPELDTNISMGGPVSNNSIHYIHTLGDIVPNSIEVKDGIYWGGDYEIIRDMVSNGMVDKRQLKFFLGYSGWYPNQLKSELSQNSWIVTDLKPSIIMREKMEDFWEDVLISLGDKYKVWLNAPESPGFN